jgi:hypothetical protein
LDHDGLAAALNVFVAEEEKLPGSATYRVQSHLHSEPPESARVILYRIAQEALVNVRKHAHATEVEITLEEGAEGYTLQVKDNGDRLRTFGDLGSVARPYRSDVDAGASLAGRRMVPHREHRRLRHDRRGLDPSGGGGGGGMRVAIGR